MTEPTSDTEPSEHRAAGADATRATVARLDESVVERIAAGEVVRRPASVVTELIENGLDADATSITVSVATGGTERISVADNGCGMEREDAILAVDRHTTSKIREPEDVGRVSTLGFRGEALSSIARMSRLTLRTNAGGVRGTEITIDGDGTKEVSVAGRDVGTTVTVRDLFYNTPARRKSLASTKREFAAISAVVTEYALCRPDVRFRLEHDGHEVFGTPGSGSYTDAVLGTYGRDAAAQSTEIDADSVDTSDRGDDGNAGGKESDMAGITVTGLCAHPSATRASADHVHTAINGRAVADGTIREAALAGYGSLLPTDRYPICVLDVSLSPEAVDVNVHPTKAEVAFREPEAVATAVERAVSRTLRTTDLSRAAELEFDLDASLEPVSGESVFETCAVIGRFRGAYVLCESDEDLLVIDQHAAHERINYERLRDALDDAPIESVSVDPPATVALSPTESAVLDAEHETIERIGYDVADVGGGMCRVAGVPAPFGRVAEPDAIRDALAAVNDGDSDDPREELLRAFACHPSLKAGDEVSDERARELLVRLGACEQPFSCPHGRPTVLSIDERAFVRGFERSSRRLG